MNHSEHNAQVAIFKWRDAQKAKYPVLKNLFSVPNAFKRTPRQGKWLKDEGMTKGIPDLWFPVARKGYHGLVVELKPEHIRGVTEKRYATAEQQDWLNRLERQGYKTAVCYGSQEFVDLLADYLDGETT